MKGVSGGGYPWEGTKGTLADNPGVRSSPRGGFWGRVSPGEVNGTHRLKYQKV